jgi:hypothetical protein
MQWWLRIGEKPRQGNASGSGRKTGLTHHFEECNVCEDAATKAETQKIKNEPGADLRDIDADGGHAKPDQYGRGVCRLGRGPARARGGEAFLRRAPFAY